MIRRLWSGFTSLFAWPELEPMPRAPRMAEVFRLPLRAGVTDVMFGRVSIFDAEEFEVAGPLTPHRAEAFVRAVHTLHASEEAELKHLAGSPL